MIPTIRETLELVRDDYNRTSKGGKLTLWIFYLTCLHTAFVQPIIEIIPGERSKVISGIIGCVVLLCIFLFTPWRENISRREMAICGTLLILMAISGVLSDTPVSSSLRGFVIASTSLAGFMAARVVLSNHAGKAFFVWFCCALFMPLIVVSALGHIHYGNISYLMEGDMHPLATRYFLLFFAPVTLLLNRRPVEILLGVLILLGTYTIFYASNLRSAMLIPTLLLLVTIVFGVLKPRHVIFLIIPLLVVLFFFFKSLPEAKMKLEHEPAYYRAESYTVALHIALKHPWFGIGLLAPKEKYLQDYELWYPYVTREQFLDSLRRTITAENIYLNFMEEVGIPFTLIYFGALGYLFFILARRSRENDTTDTIPALALLLSLLAASIHFLVLDGLMHPQVCWYYHLLVGLIPVSTLQSKRE